MPNILVILSLISFLSIIVVTGSPLKSYTNFYENNNHILLKLTPIYAQDNSGYFDDDDIFPNFKTEDDGGNDDGDIFPDYKTEDDGGKEKDGGGDGGKEKDGGGDGGKEKDGGGDGGKEVRKEKDGGGDGGKEKDGGGDGGKEKDGDEEKDEGNEGRINENTNGISPLSSGSPTNTDV